MRVGRPSRIFFRFFGRARLGRVGVVFKTLRFLLKLLLRAETDRRNFNVLFRLLNDASIFNFFGETIDKISSLADDQRDDGDPEQPKRGRSPRKTGTRAASTSRAPLLGTKRTLHLGSRYEPSPPSSAPRTNVIIFFHGETLNPSCRFAGESLISTARADRSGRRALLRVEECANIRRDSAFSGLIFQ